MVRLMSILALSITMFGCLKGQDDSPATSSTSTHPVSVRLGSNSVVSIMDLFIPKAHAAVSDLTLCFKRLRFKKAEEETLDTENDEDNVDLNLGSVSISSTGSALADVVIPAGNYNRVEFDLEPECAGKSVSLTNDFGTFTSTEHITIKFEGAFVVDNAKILELSTQAILDAVNVYNGGEELHDTLEHVSNEGLLEDDNEVENEIEG